MRFTRLKSYLLPAALSLVFTGGWFAIDRILTTSNFTREGLHLARALKLQPFKGKTHPGPIQVHFFNLSEDEGKALINDETYVFERDDRRFDYISRFDLPSTNAIRIQIGFPYRGFLGTGHWLQTLLYILIVFGMGTVFFKQWMRRNENKVPDLIIRRQLVSIQKKMKANLQESILLLHKTIEALRQMVGHWGQLKSAVHVGNQRLTKLPHYLKDLTAAMNVSYEQAADEIQILKRVKKILENVGEEGFKLQFPLDQALAARMQNQKSLQHSQTLLKKIQTECVEEVMAHMNVIHSSTQALSTLQGDLLENIGNTAVTLNAQKRASKNR